MQEARLVGEAGRAKPARRGSHLGPGEGPVEPVALCHDLGPAGSRHGMETRSKARRLCQLSPRAAGETRTLLPYFRPFSLSWFGINLAHCP